MPHQHKPRVNPNVRAHFEHAVHQEIQAISSFMKFMWPLVLLFLIGIVTLVYIARPLPPTRIKIATGQANSSLEKLGKEYEAFFEKKNVDLELVPSAGALENLELLKQGKVDAAFTLGGMSVGADAPDIRTLGSVEYQPFWLFYRGQFDDEKNILDFLKNHMFSINIPGSGTRYMAEKIFRLHGISTENNEKLLSLSSPESVDALLNGKIDGVFLTASVDSQTIEKILQNPSIRIFDFSMSDAYTKKLKFLETIHLPKGSFDLVKFKPEQDVKMVATTTDILINKNLHPGIQYLFLHTAYKLDHTSKSFFNRSGGFPAYTISQIPLSDTADRYYTKGMPALYGYVPFWVSSFFDQIWLLALAGFAIVYPLFKIIPNLRKLYVSFCLVDCYEELTDIDNRLMKPLDSDQFHHLLEEFDKLEHKINHLWIPSNAQADFYILKNSVEVVRSRLIRAKAGFITWRPTFSSDIAQKLKP